MACRFIDGFDHVAVADVVTKWGDGSAPNAIVAGRWAGSAIQSTDTRGGPQRTFDNQATWVVGLATKISALGNANRLISFLDSGTLQFEVRFDATGHLLATRNGTTIATSTATLTSGVWAYVEIKVTINGTTGSYELRVDGVTWLSGSGISTRGGTSNNSANQVGLWGGSSRNVVDNHLIDDCYILDGSGSVNNDFLGEQRVQTSFVSGAGTYAQFTPSASTNNTNVDDATPNGDTDYNSSSTVNQIDSFALGDLASGTQAPAAVQAVVWARKDDAGARSLAPFFRIGGSDYAGTGQALGSGYGAIVQTYDTSPATSVAWTASEVNGAEGGYTVTA
jgi:hypothetical protein